MLGDRDVQAPTFGAEMGEPRDVAGAEASRSGPRVGRHQLRRIIDVRQPHEVAKFVQKGRSPRTSSVLEPFGQIATASVEHDLSRDERAVSVDADRDGDRKPTIVLAEGQVRVAWIGPRDQHRCPSLSIPGRLIGGTVSAWWFIGLAGDEDVQTGDLRDDLNSFDQVGSQILRGVRAVVDHQLDRGAGVPSHRRAVIVGRPEPERSVVMGRYDLGSRVLRTQGQGPGKHQEAARGDTDQNEDDHPDQPGRRASLGAWHARLRVVGQRNHCRCGWARFSVCRLRVSTPGDR